MGAAEIKAAAAGAEPLCRGSIDLELTEKLPLEMGFVLLLQTPECGWCLPEFPDSCDSEQN